VKESKRKRKVKLKAFKYFLKKTQTKQSHFTRILRPADQLIEINTSHVM